MNMQGLINYKITCKDCEKSTPVGLVNGQSILWNNGGNIISGRKRLDGEWGWQCMCGNNDILTKQEERQITNKQEPDKKEIEHILKNLKPDKPKFDMVKS